MIYAEKHLSLLSRMGRDGLQLRFTGEFPEEILDQTCKKIEDMGLQEQIRKEEATQIQRELIQVPEFAELYQALCAHGIAVSVTAASTSVWRPGRIWPDGTGASSPCRRR